jgi:hypothetical protein
MLVDFAALMFTQIYNEMTMRIVQHNPYRRIKMNQHRTIVGTNKARLLTYYFGNEGTQPD